MEREAPGATRRRLNGRLSSLKSVRAHWEPAYRDLADYIAPRRLRLTNSTVTRTIPKKIIDTTGSQALKTLAAGMYTGISGPSRPWFRYLSADQDLNKYDSVKTFLNIADREVRQIFRSATFYSSLHAMYGDLGQFGTSAGIMTRSLNYVLSLKRLVTGQYWIAQNGEGTVDTLYRVDLVSVRNVVFDCVYRGNKANKPEWSVASNTVKNLYDRHNLEAMVPIYHAIEPREDRDISKRTAEHKPFSSLWWEQGGDDDRMLKVSGFDKNPILAPRWQREGEDPYGDGPAYEALPDIKRLQKQQLDKGISVEMRYKPPVNLPAEMRNQAYSFLPGRKNYMTNPAAQAYHPLPPQQGIQDLSAEVEDTRHQINQAMYADLFLMISQMEGIQPRNQMEIAERKEEKLQALGPVYENLHVDLLRPAINFGYDAANDAGRLPPVPDELDNQDLKIDYVSILAQAMKAVSTGGVERLWSFAGNLAGVKPTVLDKLDEDQSLDEYADYLGVSAGIVRSDDEVSKIRDQRIQQEQQAAQMAQAQAVAPVMKDGAQAAKVLSEVDENSGANDLLRRLNLA